MVTGHVTTAGVNILVLALTPIERWQAARRFNNSFVTEGWFILIAIAALIILTVLLLMVSYHKRTSKKQSITREQLFVKYAEKRGLSRHERYILLDIARQAGLKRYESIFVLGDAFERGATAMMKKTLMQGRATKQSSTLKTELSFLREKLGFQKQLPVSIGSPTKLRKLSSRQIPEGKKVHLTRRNARDSKDIEATVIENDDTELTVKLAMPVKITFGESWRARYYFEASVWEFDTSVVSYDGDILVLNHNDDVRFINRRRFLRVPVNKPAFVAKFPFARALTESSDNSEEGSQSEPGSTKSSGSLWGPPEFVPAVVTELAGVGLRIEAPLETEAGDRILVMFRLDEEDQDSTTVSKDGKTPTTKIIEDIGQVRHTKVTQNGLSIAVELTGLSDSDVNELIRATNAASVKAGTEGQNIPAPAGNEPRAEGNVPEPTVV